jgi:hypothetical protein
LKLHTSKIKNTSPSPASHQQMFFNNLTLLVTTTLLACTITGALAESSKTENLLRSQNTKRAKSAASCQASSLTDLLQCASSTSHVPFCLGRCGSNDADDHMDGTFTASSAIDGGASNELSVTASLDVVNINQFIGATLPLPEKVQKMTQVILGPVGEVGIQNVVASIAGQAGVSATAYSVSMSLSGEPFFGDKNLCPTPLSIFGCAFQALKGAKGWALTLEATFEGGAFENTITINTPPVGAMIDSSGNGLSFFLVMEMEYPYNEIPSFEVGITFGVKVAVGNKENPRDIIFEGSLSKPIGDTSLGGSLAMVGAWVNVMNMPFFHIADAHVGAYVEPGIPPVVTEFELGAQMCFGSRQACGFGAVADGSSGTPGSSDNFIKGLVHMYYVLPTAEDDFAPSDDNFFVMMLSEMSLKKILGIMGDIIPGFAGLAESIPSVLLESGIYPIPNPAIDCSAVGTSTDITTSPPECFARVSFSPLPGNSVGSYTVPEGMALAGRKLCLYMYIFPVCFW